MSGIFQIPIPPGATVSFGALVSAPKFVSAAHFTEQLQLLIASHKGEVKVPRISTEAEPLHLLLDRLDVAQVQMVELTSGADHLGAPMLGMNLYFASGILVLEPRWLASGQNAKDVVCNVGAPLCRVGLESITRLEGAGQPIGSKPKSVVISLMKAAGSKHEPTAAEVAELIKHFSNALLALPMGDGQKVADVVRKAVWAALAVLFLVAAALIVRA